MRHHSIAALFASTFAGLSLVPIGCGGDDEDPVAEALAELGGGCLLDSDCQQTGPRPLICVFQRCHEECNTSADCDPGVRCMIGTKPDHYCQLPDEVEVECTYNSQCPPGQICARDGQCRNECEADRDCVSDQICVTHTCAREDELDGDVLPLAIVPDAPDTGHQCDYDSQCKGEDPGLNDLFVCRGGVCAYECLADADCDPNHTCEPAGGGLCAPVGEGGIIHCIPGSQIACACPDGSTGVQVCEPDGASVGDCVDQAGQVCAAQP